MDKRRVSLSKAIDENKVYAFLSYFLVLCAIPLIYKKEDAFVQSHARQGLALFLCEFVAFLATIILPWLLRPFLFVFGLFALWGMVKALKGEKVELPFVYPLSKGISL